MDTLERIELLLKTQDKSNYIVAKNCGLNMNAFSDWKTGKSKPSADSIVKVANYFGVTTDYLLCVSDSPYRSDASIKENPKSISIELTNILDNLPRDSQQRLLGYAQCLLESKPNS